MTHFCWPIFWSLIQRRTSTTALIYIIFSFVFIVVQNHYINGQICLPTSIYYILFHHLQIQLISQCFHWIRLFVFGAFSLTKVDAQTPQTKNVTTNFELGTVFVVFWYLLLVLLLWLWRSRRVMMNHPIHLQQQTNYLMEKSFLTSGRYLFGSYLVVIQWVCIIPQIWRLTE